MVNPNRGAWRGGHVNGRGGPPSSPATQAPTTHVDIVSPGVAAAAGVPSMPYIPSNRGGGGPPRGGRGFIPSSRGRGFVPGGDRGRGIPRGGFRGRGRGSFAAPLAS